MKMWPFTLMRKYNLQRFKNKVLWKIFGPKKDEVIGEWEITWKYNSYSLPNFSIT